MTHPVPTGVGYGGGFGVTAQDGDCAVDGCEAPGKMQTCPADGKLHRHGMVHYRHMKSDLPFREGWHLICDEHYKALTEGK